MGNDNGNNSNTAIRVAIITGLFTIVVALLTIIGGPLIEDWRQSRRRPATNIPVVRPSEPPTGPSIEPATEPPITTGEVVINDRSDSPSPDFLTLVVRYDAKMVYIVIALSGVESLSNAEHIYMYGSKIDEVQLNSETFTVNRDNDGDGLFEEVVYSGTIERERGSSISIKIPIEYLPDISQKKIWGYSLESKDRIPDEGEVYLSTPTP